MSFQVEKIGEIPIARVVVAAAQGSVPREVGATMLVGPDTVDGTIGGGALEHQAIDRARHVLRTRRDQIDRMPLGPGLGQCCGGAVTLLTEVWDKARLGDVTDLVARPLPGQSAGMPLSVKRAIAQARNSGVLHAPGILDGWMVEPVLRPGREIWVWGAGHVGRALIGALAPLPDLRLRWADSGKDRFPKDISVGVETVIAANPADLVTLSGPDAEHVVLTYSHALDLEICHRVLGRPFRSLGLIGSATKRARFRSRLHALGHTRAQIERMDCPIGDPALGKHPQAIALGVATRLLCAQVSGAKAMDKRA
jgi:xanthine dehydrogenase accessory factor